MDPFKAFFTIFLLGPNMSYNTQIIMPSMVLNTSQNVKNDNRSMKIVVYRIESNSPELVYRQRREIICRLSNLIIISSITEQKLLTTLCEKMLLNEFRSVTEQLLYTNKSITKAFESVVSNKKHKKGGLTEKNRKDEWYSYYLFYYYFYNTFGAHAVYNHIFEHTSRLHGIKAVLLSRLKLESKPNIVYRAPRDNHLSRLDRINICRYFFVYNNYKKKAYPKSKFNLLKTAVDIHNKVSLNNSIIYPRTAADKIDRIYELRRHNADQTTGNYLYHSIDTDLRCIHCIDGTNEYIVYC